MNGVPDGIVSEGERTAHDHTTTGYFTPEVFYSAVRKVLAHDNPFGAEMSVDKGLLRKTSGLDISRRARLSECNRRGHLCDELCRCPVDGLVLLYHARTDEHACQDLDCVFAHGMKHKTWMPVIGRQGIRARYDKALADAQAAQPLGRHPDVARQHVQVAAFRAIGYTLAADLGDLGKVVRLDQKKAECSCLPWGLLGWERIGRDGIRRDLAEGDEIDPYCPEHGE